MHPICMKNFIIISKFCAIEEQKLVETTKVLKMCIHSLHAYVLRLRVASHTSSMKSELESDTGRQSRPHPRPATSKSSPSPPHSPKGFSPSPPHPPEVSPHSTPTPP